MPPRRQTRIVRTIALIKRNPWKVIAAVIATLGGLPAAWAGANLLEPVVPAHRGYVRTVMEPVLSAVRDSQIEQAEGKRDAAKEAKTKWLLERSKTKDSTTIDMIDHHIGELDVTIDKLNAQIKTLSRLRGQ